MTRAIPNSAGLEREHHELVHRLGCLVSRFRRMGYGPAMRAGVALTVDEVDGLLEEMNRHIEFEEKVLIPSL